MGSLSSGILAIVVVVIGIAVVQFAASRIVNLCWPGQSGLMIILLPLGLNCFDWAFPATFTAAWIIGGLFVLLWGVRRTMERAATT